MSVPISVLIPTFNEEANIAQCLGSVLEWADEVFVVDSFSTDRTVEIAHEMGAKVVQHKFDGYAAQKNWALDTLPISNEWLLIVDADEYLTPEGRDEMATLASDNGNGCDGFLINRRFIFYGQWIRHCGWYPSWHLRFFRHRMGRYENRPVDEHVVLNGRIGKLKNDLIHRDCRDMDWWIAKHNRYATLSALAMQQLEEGAGAEQRIRPRFFGDHAERRRFLKERIWPHVPAKSFLFFLYLYIFRLGFLDGRKGLMFCTMHGVFQQMKAAKEWELREKHNLRPVICEESETADDRSKAASAAMQRGAR